MAVNGSTVTRLSSIPSVPYTLRWIWRSTGRNLLNNERQSIFQLAKRVRASRAMANRIRAPWLRAISMTSSVLDAWWFAAVCTIGLLEIRNPRVLLTVCTLRFVLVFAIFDIVVQITKTPSPNVAAQNVMSSEFFSNQAYYKFARYECKDDRSSGTC